MYHFKMAVKKINFRFAKFSHVIKIRKQQQQQQQQQ